MKKNGDGRALGETLIRRYAAGEHLIKKKSMTCHRHKVLDKLAALGLINADIARLLRITQPTISHWNSGTRPIPEPTERALSILVAYIETEQALPVGGRRD